MTDANDNKGKIRQIIDRLHKGENVDTVKAEFKDAIQHVSSLEIAQVEEEMIQEGVPVEQIHKLCDVHLAAFSESLKREKPLAPEGHPVRTLMTEHQAMLDLGAELKREAGTLKDFSDAAAAADKLKKVEVLIGQFKAAENHYLREENVLFPILQKKGFTQPPTIMWMEHDRIRALKKDLYGAWDQRASLPIAELSKRLEQAALGLSEMLAAHFMKENSILFPASMKVITEAEWAEMAPQFDSIGYCPFSPSTAPTGAASGPKGGVEGAEWSFETGRLTREELEAILYALPVELSFVDADDNVRFFSQNRDRIFPRTPAVLGLNVRGCHPQKSLHMVERILADFKAGKDDPASFWIDFKGRKILIQYFPVRGRDGRYLGCLEGVQDITEARALQGEKRLL
jgi:hypothetical protein